MESNRLAYRRFSAADADDLYEYLSDPAVVAFEPYDPVTRAQAAGEAARRASDPSFWAVCLKGDGKLIGNIYLAQQAPEAFGTWTLGYVFNRQHHGKGYATEAARAFLAYAFAERNAHRVVAQCNVLNRPSWRLLERLGMRREGEHRQSVFFKRNPDGTPIWHDVYSYAMLKAEWPGSCGEGA